MGISADDVREIAILARLELDEPTCARLAIELGEVIEHMSVLDELDTEGIEPLTHVADIDLRLRPDEAAPSFTQAVALADAPDVEDGCFRVPSSLGPLPAAKET